jgi:hypothetical protein
MSEDAITKRDMPLASASWCADDIQTRKPNWDAATCISFLEENEDAIQCAMIEAGWEVIDHYLRTEN